MKYQVGDRILLLHSNEEGDVVDIINDKMLLVDVGGVKFPVYMDQVDFPYFKRFSEKKIFPQKKEKKYVDDLRKEKRSSEPKVIDGMWLSFLPVMDTDEFGDYVVEELKIHLLNRTETAFKFDYKLHFFGKPDFSLKNTINPAENFYLHDISFGDLNDSPAFEFDFSLIETDRKKAEHFETSLRVKPKQIFAKIEEIKQKNQATFSFRLFENYPDRATEDIPGTPEFKNKKSLLYAAEQARKHIEPARSVVDLHIEKLSNDWKHLSNYEILSMQIKTFEKYYELALVHRLPSMVVIHGIGEGVLRDEIHDLLRLKREVKSFVNQYDPRFGYGATEIFFQY
jgi:hypothetical protein